VNNKAKDVYAGDITPIEAWKMLESDKNVILIDVRSAAEWAYVGVTDLSSLGLEAIKIEWQKFPNMETNPDFINQVKELYPDTNIKILSLCRSGQRSVASSQALTNAGYSNCYNILEGFEGGVDKDKHRSKSGGWKFDGLPWTQN
jgi:rhodanese-related sulfurtransferase